jgi:alkyldihydroxyacetonephosphate synthase
MSNQGERGRRSFWTWGWESDEPTDAERKETAKQLSGRFNREVTAPRIPKIDEFELRKPRLTIPDSLSGVVSSDHDERVIHTYGGHFLELNRALRGDFSDPPDAVAYPETESELESVLDWCNSNDHVVIPYGGGTTVVEGVSVPASAETAVTIDMERLNKVLEIDETSRAARIQAGIFGPDLETALRPKGYTLRHFPQSFPWSTLGGWIVTRSGGHYATNHTHIDDFVESLRMITPQGWWESRRLPGSGAGPSPDRLVIGSEGTLGILTEAWMRIQKRPLFRATAGVVFASWEEGYTATRHIAQAKLWPANLRLLDPSEAGRAAGLDGKQTLLIIGFESADVPQGSFINLAVDIAREFGGQIKDDDINISDGSGQTTGREGAVGNWRSSFIGVNAGMTNGLGLIGDTFETAITWDKWPEFDAQIRSRVGKVLREVVGDAASLSCRFTHIYPDGPAPYYTFSGMGTPGGEAEQWRTIKDAANEALISCGGTITHHHSVGRMHAEGWSKQRPELFESALRAAKKSVDPKSILNPGVLFETQ